MKFLYLIKRFDPNETEVDPDQWSSMGSGVVEAADARLAAIAAILRFPDEPAGGRLTLEIEPAEAD